MSNDGPTPEQGYDFSLDVLDLMEEQKADPQVVAHGCALAIGMVMAPSFESLEDADEIFEAMMVIIKESFLHSKECIKEYNAERAPGHDPKRRFDA